jgi:hypothetical protein
MFSVFWWMLFNSMFGRSAESKSEKSDHKVGKVGSLINLWELTKCSMHRTFTVKSLQLKLRSVCAIHLGIHQAVTTDPVVIPSKAGCILYFVYIPALGPKTRFIRQYLSQRCTNFLRNRVFWVSPSIVNVFCIATAKAVLPKIKTTVHNSKLGCKTGKPYPMRWICI